MLKAEGVTFAGVEAHGSGVKGVVILGGVDFPIEEAGISKQLNLGLDSGRGYH